MSLRVSYSFIWQCVSQHFAVLLLRPPVRRNAHERTVCVLCIICCSVSPLFCLFRYIIWSKATNIVNCYTAWLWRLFVYTLPYQITPIKLVTIPNVDRFYLIGTTKAVLMRRAVFKEDGYCNGVTIKEAIWLHINVFVTNWLYLRKCGEEKNKCDKITGWVTNHDWLRSRDQIDLVTIIKISLAADSIIIKIVYNRSNFIWGREHVVPKFLCCFLLDLTCTSRIFINQNRLPDLIPQLTKKNNENYVFNDK